MTDLTTWGEAVSQLLMPVPWSLHPSAESSLLLKVARTPDGGLVALATDLKGVYFDGLSKRQLTRRLTEAYRDSQASQTQSQSQAAFLGSEGEQRLEVAVNELIEGVQAGGCARIEHEAFEHLVTIALPSFSFRLVPDSLESVAAECLSVHLITPLLGLSSALLSLNKDRIDDGQLTSAIDASARAERLKEGRAVKVFFEYGGNAMGRWVQRNMGVKEKDILPISLEASRKSSPAITGCTASRSHKAPASSAASTSRTQTSQKSSDSPEKAKSSLGRRMLNHRAPQDSGEKVSWEETQAADRRSPRPSLEPKSKKGKEKASPVVEEEEEEDIGEGDEDLSPPPAQQATSPTREDSMDVDEPKADRGDPSDQEPVTESGSEGEASDAASKAQSRKRSPPPSPPSKAKALPKVSSKPAAEAIPEPKAKLTKEEKKKRDREEEEKEEMELRRQALAKAKAAAEAQKAAAAAGVKKKRKL